MGIHVCVVMVGTNEISWLPQALETLTASIFEGKLDIIYVDNCSKDESVEFINRNYPHLCLIANRQNKGFSKANNQGIEKALEMGADYVFLVNPDTQTPPYLIQHLCDFMQKHVEFGAVGPLQGVYGEPLDEDPALNQWSRLALHNGSQHVFYMDLEDYDVIETSACAPLALGRVLEHAYVQGAALFLRASYLKGYEVFDTTYHTYYEEVDLCRRLRWRGHRVGLITDLYIQHQGGGSTAGSFYKKRLMMRNKYYYLLTDPTWGVRDLKILLLRWLKNDLKAGGIIHYYLLFLNAGWLLLNLPNILRRRKNYRKMACSSSTKLLKKP